MPQLKWLALALLLPLAACGGRGDEAAETASEERRGFLSNIFGRNSEDTVQEQPLVPQVISVNLERLPGGVILRTVGLPPQQGYWDANLVELPSDDAGVLVLGFFLTPPDRATRVSTQQSREVLAGIRLSDQDIAGIREIRVISATNSLSRRP